MIFARTGRVCTVRRKKLRGSLGAVTRSCAKPPAARHCACGLAERIRFARTNSAHEKTSTCAVQTLLRTRGSVRAPQVRFLDPTTEVGLQAPNTFIGSLRVLHRFFKSVVLSRTPQRFAKSLPTPVVECSTPDRQLQVNWKAKKDEE